MELKNICKKKINDVCAMPVRVRVRVRVVCASFLFQVFIKKIFFCYSMNFIVLGVFSFFFLPVTTKSSATFVNIFSLFLLFILS